MLFELMKSFALKVNKSMSYVVISLIYVLYPKVTTNTPCGIPLKNVKQYYDVEQSDSF